jgi:1-acyl-sn-glycerol-3-phosphate acyltransferase
MAPISISLLIARAWHGFVWRTARQYFNEVRIIGAERLPSSGPALYLALHRNGAVDGFLYHRAVPRAVFMIAAQLRRSLLGRLFFSGIEVVRDKDREGSPAELKRNDAALAGCLEFLRNGGELCILPEGTSDLGPKHLPFKRGAAQIALAHLTSSSKLTVVPLGIHYERAWAFRSNVEIVVGDSIDTRLAAGTDKERLRALHERFTAALEAVGVNVASADEQRRLEALAYAATLGTSRTYFSALKTFERGVPDRIARTWERLDRQSEALGLLRHQGVPLVPVAHAWAYLLLLPPLGILTIAAMLLNLPPIALAVLAARKFADARNVIVLWRLLVGIPALYLWVCTVALFAWLNEAPLVFVCYAALTVAGALLFYRTKKLAVSVFNLLRGRTIKGELLELHGLIHHACAHAD